MFVGASLRRRVMSRPVSSVKVATGVRYFPSVSDQYAPVWPATNGKTCEERRGGRRRDIRAKEIDRGERREERARAENIKDGMM